ncbi:hypothetical protein PR048_014785 [Dryococelus australis]|uniref:Uncharacterized protein n=1 Tax=Dryococelus australis TaxID=614101 RepID=A0ABQ9HF45_9NEOP|nr:hypothetical protein PR048_014785 [Dryococelus australis]
MMVGRLDPGLVAVLCAILAAAGLARPLDRHRYDVPGAAPHAGDDATARSERSTNLSHITGTARKIQMYVKNRHLQILPDGTVNGTADDSAGRIDYSEYP